jgi:hypothetical protein
MPPDRKKETRSAILKRALQQAPAGRQLPKNWKPYLKKRPDSVQVVLRLPDDIRASLVKWLEGETSAHNTFNSFAIEATQALLANPPKTIPDRRVTDKKGFTVRWPEPLVEDTDTLVKFHGGPRKGMSRNTVILYAIEKALKHA